jgi:hypothetical protein
VQTPKKQPRNLSSATSSSQRKPEVADVKPRLMEQQKWTTCNHMENNYHLSNKKALFYNLKIYYEAL